ncbi:MAG: STAS domain-containing protein [Vulcanimicrobiaceae bacterium]
MSHDELSIDIKSEHNGDALVFKLRGSLDLATAPSVRAALLEAADDGKHEIIVDLTQLEFLDSTGLGALIGAYRRAMEHQGRVALVVNDGPIARLLNITGLMRIFSVYHTVDAALKDQDRVPAAL